VFTTLRNAWKIPELKKKLLFTLFILLIFRIGAQIPVPFIAAGVYDSLHASFKNTILELLDAMAGGSLSSAKVFALGIQPYINASIIIELLTIAIPQLERMAKEEGEEGKKKIARITRYTTVGISLLMGWAYYVMLSNNTGLLTQTGFFPGLAIVLTFAAGAAFVMWLGEQITEGGVGNGISVILFANIISRIPALISSAISYVSAAENKAAAAGILVLLLIGMLLLVAFIVFITNAERRIPVQYAKRVVGRKVYGGQNTHLPIKVSMSGVLPIIFAQSICSVGGTIATFAGKTNGWWYKNVWSSTSVIYMIFYFVLIIAFSYFYASVQYNPVEIANNLKKNGGFIPGFRPGRPTAEFIGKTIKKIVLFGALYLAVVAIMPIIVGSAIGNSSLAVGGTSVIIVVGVATETAAAIEAQMLMRNYKGFLE